MRPLGWVPPLFSLLFGIIDAGVNSLFTSFLLILCYGPLLVGYGYVINFMADAEIDRQSPVTKDVVMAKQPFAAGTLSKRQGAIIALILAVGGLFVSWHVSPSVFAVGCGLLILATAYSYPPRFKEVPLLDVLTNGAIVTLCYIAGWVAFQPISAISPYPVIWIFFLVSATYLLTVLIDVSSDRESGVRSTGVAFGESTVVKLAFVLYMISLLFYVLSAITLQRISYYLVGIGLLWAVKGFYARVRDPDPAGIYTLAKKATMAAAISIPVLGLLYSILLLLGLERY
jgi:4-hydroxybenzoate polyprenyltransferase